MRKSIYTYAIALALPVIALFTACEPRALEPEDVFTPEDAIEQELAAENPDGYKIYTLNEFLDTFMTEEGNYASDTCPYRTRSYDSTHDLYLYSVDTLPTNGPGIYIRGRITTDDYAGNFYKAMVIQQIVNGEQQNLRISVDLGSSHGMYQMGQEILIRCNGLSVGRYANQPQLCSPSYNNNIYAMSASQKVGWCPGRIQGAIFRRNTRMIGAPDRSKIQYDRMSLTELYQSIERKPLLSNDSVDDPETGRRTTKKDLTMRAIRRADGRAVIITGVHFTGQYNDNGSLKTCDTQHPDSSSNANVFAPTTNNIGYPQGRVLRDQGTNIILCSSSEYAKYANFYLPGANAQGVTDCPNWEGTISGILGWYLDKASEIQGNKLTGYEWSVTPRGIPGIGIEDIHMTYEGPNPEMEGQEWKPKEFDPNAYNPSTEE